MRLEASSYLNLKSDLFLKATNQRSLGLLTELNFIYRVFEEPCLQNLTESFFSFFFFFFKHTGSSFISLIS